MTHEQYKKAADYWKNKEITAMPEEELKSVQVMGKAELIEPFSDKYNEHAEIKKIPIEALNKLESPMNLICKQFIIDRGNGSFRLAAGRPDNGFIRNEFRIPHAKAPPFLPATSARHCGYNAMPYFYNARINPRFPAVCNSRKNKGK